jgi:hypothetical protein
MMARAGMLNGGKLPVKDGWQPQGRDTPKDTPAPTTHLKLLLSRRAHLLIVGHYPTILILLTSLWGTVCKIQSITSCLSVR